MRFCSRLLPAPAKNFSGFHWFSETKKDLPFRQVFFVYGRHFADVLFCGGAL
jgi:hypothetical protein